MRENICTIPVSEVFEKSCGCPICRIQSEINERAVEFILGDAMMEPDVRVITNHTGFCYEHLSDMLGKSKRLPMAIMLETHLQEIEEKLIPNYYYSKGKAKKADNVKEKCYVCNLIEDNYNRTIDTLFKLYKDNKEFRELFARQDYLCFPHYSELILKASKALPVLLRGKFSAECAALAKGQVIALRKQLSEFRDAYDYHNNGRPVPEKSIGSIERTIEFLTSKKVKE